MHRSSVESIGGTWKLKIAELEVGHFTGHARDRALDLLLGLLPRRVPGRGRGIADCDHDMTVIERVNSGLGVDQVVAGHVLELLQELLGVVVAPA